MRSITRNLIATLLLLLTVAPPAQAVFNMTGSRNFIGITEPDVSFPSGNVGTLSTTACAVTYLRNRWVIAARHCGPTRPYFSGILYEMEAGVGTDDPASVRRFDLLKNDGITICEVNGIDIIAFRLAAIPAGTIEMSYIVTPPETNESVVVTGNCATCEMGASTTCSVYGQTTPAWTLIGTNAALTWGTNRVDAPPTGVSERCDDNEQIISTRLRMLQVSLSPVGDPDMTASESSSSGGDSGGGIFVKRNNIWYLAGVLTGGDNICSNHTYIAKTAVAVYNNFFEIGNSLNEVIGPLSARRCSQ